MAKAPVPAKYSQASTIGRRGGLVLGRPHAANSGTGPRALSRPSDVPTDTGTPASVPSRPDWP
jgi:hypothetical protein